MSISAIVADHTSALAVRRIRPDYSWLTGLPSEFGSINWAPGSMQSPVVPVFWGFPGANLLRSTMISLQQTRLVKCPLDPWNFRGFLDSLNAT